MSNKTAESANANADGPDSDSNKNHPSPSIFERMKSLRRNRSRNAQHAAGYDSSSLSEEANKEDMWTRGADEVVENISFTFDNSFNEDEDEIKQSIESMNNSKPHHHHHHHQHHQQQQYSVSVLRSIGKKRKKMTKSSSASPSSPLSSNYVENENGDEADNDDYENEDETEINDLRNKWRRSNIASSKTFDGCFSILADKSSANDLTGPLLQQQNSISDKSNMVVIDHDHDHDDHHHHHENPRNKDKNILQSHQEITDCLNETSSNQTTTTVSNPAGEVSALAGTTVTDETTNEANTDVSDPHWDGYTVTTDPVFPPTALRQPGNFLLTHTSLFYQSSPFYSNSVTVEDICINEKVAHIQPILPWDELFFELEPIDDTPAVKLNVSIALFIAARQLLNSTLWLVLHPSSRRSNNNHGLEIELE